jgi:transposase
VPALPSSILEALWVQVSALLPARQVHHPLGCHRQRIPDRVIFDKLIQVLVFGCDYRRIADHTCSASTLRRRRDEWISAGVAEQLRLAVLGAYQRLFGLELEHLAVDGCITKAPCGGQVAGPSPVDRRKQGLKRSTMIDAGGIPLGVVAAGANRRDDGLLAATLDTLGVVGVLPERPVVHLDAGYDWQTCWQVLAERRMVGEIATRGMPAPIQAGRRWPWSVPTLGEISTASCDGAPSAAGSWWSSGWRWRPPRSCAAGWSIARGPAIAGMAGHGDGRDHLWRSPLARVSLDTGQSRQVSVAFPVSRLAVTVGDIDAAGREMQPGAYQVQVEDLTATSRSPAGAGMGRRGGRRPTCSLRYAGRRLACRPARASAAPTQNRTVSA